MLTNTVFAGTFDKPHAANNNTETMAVNVNPMPGDTMTAWRTLYHLYLLWLVCRCAQQQSMLALLNPLPQHCSDNTCKLHYLFLKDGMPMYPPPAVFQPYLALHQACNTPKMLSPSSCSTLFVPTQAKCFVLTQAKCFVSPLTIWKLNKSMNYRLLPKH